MTKRLVLGIFVAVVVVAALGGAAFGAYTLRNEGQAEARQVSWGNVTVTIPSGSDIQDLRLMDDPPAEAQGFTGPVLKLIGSGHESVVTIDAETGKVVRDDVLASDRAAFDAILATLTVGQAQTAAGASAPWPYGATLPSTPRRQLGPITFVEPDPAAGIAISIVEYDGLEPNTSGSSVEFYNTRSALWIDAKTGELESDLSAIHPDDREAFDRLFAQIEVASQ
ncbi:MAG: hypothetical protein MUP14_09910 [Dehalococcoidia bacterium]|nr:hypothetical protein [Dehalococcoidia bacterium]